MKAFVGTDVPGVGYLKDVPKPKPGPGQVLVKVLAAAQNTAEWMVLARAPIDIVIGQDFAGIVEELGPDVPDDLSHVGHRVAGTIFGGVDKDTGGTYAEYCVADASLLITVPESWTFEDAAGIPHCALTAAQALWQTAELSLPTKPNEESQSVLVWGGATAVGQFAIQLAKLSGYQVVTTASPPNFDLMKSLGAVAVYDYHDSDVSLKIREEWAPRVAVDCFSSTDEGAKAVCDSISSEGGRIALVRVAKSSREDVTAKFGLVFTLLGKPIDWYSIPVMPDHYELGKQYVRILSDLVAKGAPRSTPTRVIPHGLRDAQHWIDYQKEGKVRAEKITYLVADTPNL